MPKVTRGRAHPAADPNRHDRREEILRGDRCSMCESAGRALILARTHYVLLVLCTICWCEVIVVQPPAYDDTAAT